MFTRDIYFKCPCCRKPLVVERAAAGFDAPCPGCGASVRIPTRSGIPPKVVRWARMIALNAAIAGLAFAAYSSFPRAAPVVAAPVSDRPHAKAKAPAVDPAVIVSNANARLDDLLARNRELAEHNQALSTQFEAMASWVVDTYQGKYPLPLDLVAKLRLKPVTDDFVLSPEVTLLLRISEQESTLANDAFAYTRERMQKAESALVSVTHATDNSVTLYVPPYQKEGTALREDLFGALESALGAPRFDKFVDVTQDDLAQTFHYFGTAARTMQFEVVPPQGNEPSYLLIRDSWQIPDGESVTRYDGSEAAVREIPRQYSAYLNWLPNNVAAFPVQKKNGS